MYRKWTKEEEQTLKEYYPNSYNEDLAILFGRTVMGVKHKAYKIGVLKSAEFKRMVLSGRKAHNVVPIGTDTKRNLKNGARWHTKIGYRKWKLSHHLVHELHTGKTIDYKKEAVIFIDGNIDNWRDFNNLKLVKRSTLLDGKRNHKKGIAPRTIVLRNKKKSFTDWVLSGSVPTTVNNIETWT